MEFFFVCLFVPLPIPHPILLPILSSWQYIHQTPLAMPLIRLLAPPRSVRIQPAAWFFFLSVFRLTVWLNVCCLFQFHSVSHCRVPAQLPALPHSKENKLSLRASKVCHGEYQDVFYRKEKVCVCADGSDGMLLRWWWQQRRLQHYPPLTCNTRLRIIYCHWIAKRLGIVYVV